jgi:hypothetical protein
MPVPPPTPAAPYDTLESVLNVARARLNDMIASVNGDILTDNQPFTATMTNSAWRKLQQELSNLGYSKYKRKFWAYNMPPVASTDPSSCVIWNWAYYFDGVSYWYPPNVNLFPSDMISPLVIKERISGSNAIFWPPKGMPCAPDGLPEGPKRPWNGIFEWKNDAVYMPGSTSIMDLEVEYAAYDYDFVSTDNVLGNPSTSPPTTPANMPVPIMRSQSALANYLCAEMAQGRTDVDGPAFEAAGKADAQILMNNSDVKLKQRHPVQRGSYNPRGRMRGSAYAYTG